MFDEECLPLVSTRGSVHHKGTDFPVRASTGWKTRSPLCAAKFQVSSFNTPSFPSFSALPYLTLKPLVAIMTLHLKKTWHRLARIVVIMFAVIGFFTAAHQATHRSDDAMCEHGDDGGSQAVGVCICACHAALVPAFSQDLCGQEQIIFVSSEYVILLGTYVPTDIFRPPLVNS